MRPFVLLHACCPALLLLAACSFPHKEEADLGSLTTERAPQPPAYRFPTLLAVTEVVNPGSNHRKPTPDHPFTEHEIERIDRLANLDGLAGIVRMHRLCGPEAQVASPQLVTRANQAGAGLLLVLTRGVRAEDHDYLPPLSLLTLGLAPCKSQETDATGSAILIDTATGSLVDAYAVSDDALQLCNGWTSSSALNDAWTRAERRAFDKLLDQLESRWPALTAARASTQRATRQPALNAPQPPGQIYLTNVPERSPSD